MNPFERPPTGNHPEEHRTELLMVDRESPELLEALKNAPLYKKFGTVEARCAVPGETLSTTLSNGFIETTHIAENEPSWVVKNPNGEEYILLDTKFQARYKGSEKSGVYIPTGYCRAIANPYCSPIEIQASWGSPQTGDENCLFADECDENGENMGGMAYLIGADEFKASYRAV